MRLAAQVVSGEKINLETGKVAKMGEAGTKGKVGTTLQFARGKLSPAASLGVDVGLGKTYMGEETTLPREAAKNFLPLYVQDLQDAWESMEGETGRTAKVAGMTAIPGFFGVGVQTHETKKSELEKKRAASMQRKKRKSKSYGFSDELIYRLWSGR